MLYKKLLRYSQVFRKMEAIRQAYAVMLPQDERISDRLELTDLGLANQSGYIRNWVGYPIYQNTDLNFFSQPEKLLPAMKAELKKARKFIFLESHVMVESVIWKGLEAILKEKAAEGVEIRILYDGTGSSELNHDRFAEHLMKHHIQCRVFHRKKGPFDILKYCDYRKMLIIDGRCAFTGDYDFTNDQFNLEKPKQDWKISGLRMYGDAVRNMTFSFLSMWNVEDEKPEDPIPYLLKTAYRSAESGYVQPFTTDPMLDEQAGKETCLNVIRGARKYIYLTGPENVTDPDLKRELLSAAKRGIRIYMILPQGKDTRTEHPEWETSGQIRIFRYTAGRIQTRQIVADDQVAIVGNIHMDQKQIRSNFENGCWFAQNRAVLSVKHDFEKMLPYCTELVTAKAEEPVETEETVDEDMES